MPFESKNVVRTWLFITIASITAIKAFESGDKKLDLKIGFKLKQGANGAPSQRIRDFQESSEFNARRIVDSLEINRQAGRRKTNSFSESTSAESLEKISPSKPKDPIIESSKEKGSKSKGVKTDSDEDNDNDDNDSSTESKKLSTRGLKAEEYEPEENPKIHGKPNLNSDEDSDKNDRRRRKRHAIFRHEYKWRRYM